MKQLILSVLFLSLGLRVQAQSEQLKDVVNNLAFYNTKKDIKFLGEAKKAVDKAFFSEKDTNNLEKSVYRVAVYSSILYVDTNNTLGQPDTFLRYTTRLLRNVQVRPKVYNYQSLVDYSKRCLANAYLRKGTISYKNGDYAQAAGGYQEAKRLYPEIPNADAYLARAYEKAGKTQMAGEAFNKLTGDDDAPVTYFQSAAAAYLSVKDTAEALGMIRKGRRRYPQDAYLLTQEANIYNNKSDFVSLKPILNDLVKLNPNDEKTLFLAASCLDHLNDFDNSASFYNRIVEINSNAYQSTANLGYLYLRKAARQAPAEARKSIGDAQIWLERANELNPDDVNCLKGLQIVYEQARNDYQLRRVQIKLRQLSK